MVLLLAMIQERPLTAVPTAMEITRRLMLNWLEIQQVRQKIAIPPTSPKSMAKTILMPME